MDNDFNGVRSTIDVLDNVMVNIVKVEVDIQYIFVGDLKVMLIVGGYEVVLYDCLGGSADNI